MLVEPEPQLKSRRVSSRRSKDELKNAGAARCTLGCVSRTELSTPAGAQLWACLLEAAGRGVHSVEEYVTAVTGAAGAIASAQLASGVFA